MVSIMKNVVIFDCNGIFLKFGKKFVQAFTEDFEIPTEEFLPIHMEIMNNIRRPDAPDLFELWQPYLAAWGLELDKQGFYDYWFGREKEVPEMFDIVKSLQTSDVTVVILSNNFRERYLEKKEFFDRLNNLCDFAYYSWTTGFVKPHADAFNFVLASNNWEAEQCLFFDDSIMNVTAAQDLGIEAHHFKDVAGCKKILKEHNLL